MQSRPKSSHSCDVSVQGHPAAACKLDHKAVEVCLQVPSLYKFFRSWSPDTEPTEVPLLVAPLKKSLTTFCAGSVRYSGSGCMAFSICTCSSVDVLT